MDIAIRVLELREAATGLVKKEHGETRDLADDLQLYVQFSCMYLVQRRLRLQCAAPA
jgi:hypothetical protein